jgi:hypothetical protein
LDSAIAGIQNLVEPPVETHVTVSGKSADEIMAVPILESFSSSEPIPNVPAERHAPLQRPVFTPAPERRKPAALNIYVNRNSDWASRQLVPAQSARAVFRHKAEHNCPKCGSQDTRVSHTRGIADMFMFLFDYSMARCRNCDLRFRIWQSRAGDDELRDVVPQPQRH